MKLAHEIQFGLQYIWWWYGQAINVMIYIRRVLASNTFFMHDSFTSYNKQHTNNFLSACNGKNIFTIERWNVMVQR